MSERGISLAQNCCRRSSFMKAIVLVTTAVLFAAPVAAQNRTPGSTQNRPPATPKSASEPADAKADKDFIVKAAQGGMAEVELGKLAAEKATNDQVKKFAQRMVDDHGKAGKELKEIADRKNISLPSEMDSKERALKDRLSKLSGDAFDRAYMQEMVSDHQKVLKEFQAEAKSGRDAETK